jgi:hypothetical protein
MTTTQISLIDKSAALRDAAVLMPSKINATMQTLEPTNGIYSTGSHVKARSADRGDARTDFLPSKTDPTVLARQVAVGMRAGARSVIEACIVVFQALRQFEPGSNLRDQFRMALVSENVIPRRSARLGIDDSKLSMLKKIGEYAHVLLDDEIIRYLEPGRSVLFHVIRLFEELPGNHADRTAHMAELFEAEGNLSRDFLIDQVNKAMRAREPANLNAVDPWTSGTGDRDFELILAVLDGRRSRRLNEEFVDPLPCCQRIHERASEDAVFVVVASLSDLGIVQDKLLAGFAYQRILLLHDPLDPDVTEAQVAVVSTRTRKNCNSTTKFQWMPHGEPLDATSLAEKFAPHAKKKLRLFATEQSEGWISIIGKTNWRQIND